MTKLWATLADDGMTVTNLYPLPDNLRPGVDVLPADWRYVEAPTGTTLPATYANGSFTSGRPALQIPLPLYMERIMAAKLAAGITVNVAASGSPILILADGTDSTIGHLNGLALWGTLHPDATDVWHDNNWLATTLTGAQFVTLGTAVKGWVSNMYAALGTLIAQWGAGTITSAAQVDAFVWPTS